MPTQSNSDKYQPVREFLLKEEWVVYKIKDGKFFGDTYFGPMWKNFPEGIDATGLELNSMREVVQWMYFTG